MSVIWETRASCRARRPYYTGTLKPDVCEAFFILRERAPFPLEVINQWPDELEGFRETLVEYFEESETLFRRVLPLFAAALDLAPTYFDDAFGEYEALSMLRVAHFPPDDLEPDQFNVGPHTDSSFVTLLATTEIPGLELLGPSGEWFPAPPIPGSILVNSGDLLTRWSNGRFLSTPHRVINRSGRHRYSIPLFVHPNPGSSDRMPVDLHRTRQPAQGTSDHVGPIPGMVHGRKLRARGETGSAKLTASVTVGIASLDIEVPARKTTVLPLEERLAMTDDGLISLELIDRLISFDTTSNRSNLPLIEFVQGYLAEYGIESHLTFDDSGEKANLFASLGPVDRPGIILSGHTDIVPVANQNWTVNPYSVTRKGERLYGRGMADMKAYIAVSLAFAKVFQIAGCRCRSTMRSPMTRRSALWACRGLSRTCLAA